MTKDGRRNTARSRKNSYEKMMALSSSVISRMKSTEITR